MIIKKVTLFNFGLYAGEQSIYPATSLNGKVRPITLIGGFNGGGKTTLLDAVLLTLYGNRSSSFRESGKSYSDYLDSYMHKGPPKAEETWAELVIDVPVNGDFVTLRIRRSWKLANVRVTDKLEIWRDEVPDDYLASNWHVYVEELLPSGVAGLFFFDGEKISRLAEEEETGETMRRAICSLLGVDVIDRVITDMERIIKRNHEKEFDVRYGPEIARLEGEAKHLAEKIEATKQELASITVRIQRLEGKLVEKENEYLQKGGSLEGTRPKLDAQRSKLLEKLARNKDEFIALASGPLPLTLVKPLLERVNAVLTREKEIKQAKIVLPMLRNRDENLLAQLAKLGVDTRVVNQIHLFLEAERAELERIAEQEERFSLSETGEQQIKRFIEQDEKKLRGLAKRLIEETVHLEKNLESIERHLLVDVDQESLTDSLKEFKEISQKIALLQIEKGQKQAILNDLTVQFNQTEAKWRTLINKSLDQKERSEEAARIIRYALRTQDTMKVFKQRVIEQKVDELASVVSESFKFLTHKKSLVSEVRIDPASLRISLYDSLGHEVHKTRLSAGEKQMLAISLLWGLARASGRALPVIIDTPMGRLDSSHRINFVKRYLPHASHQVIVLSTDTEIEGLYLNKLKSYIGKKYFLNYSDDKRATTIEEGYFS